MIRKSFIFISASLLLASCAGNNKEMTALMAERDSLKVEDQLKQERLVALNTAMETISVTMDSIDIQENRIFYEEGEVVDKAEALGKLDRYENFIKTQQDKIRDLEKQLRRSKSKSKELSSMITRLKKQLAEKDEQISVLRKEVSEKDASLKEAYLIIEEHKTTIAQQTQTISDLDELSKHQKNVMQGQDEALHTAYVVMGSKKDLTAKGLLKRGKVISEKVADNSLFEKIDIRESTRFTIPAKRVKVLTDMPEGAYNLYEEGKDTYILEIVDTKVFWSITRYLIIQTY